MAKNVLPIENVEPNENTSSPVAHYTDWGQ